MPDPRVGRKDQFPTFSAIALKRDRGAPGTESAQTRHKLGAKDTLLTHPLAYVFAVHELTPSQKGAVAEAAITAMAIQLGLTVLRPLCEGRRYDLVIDLDPRLLRVQCKLAQRLSGVLSVRLMTNRCTPSGYVSTSYTAAEVDAIAAYSPELNRCFLIPISEVSDRRGIHLRLDPTKNNQNQGITWADDYELGVAIQRHRADERKANG
jgi:hypothetical protein